MKFEQTEVMNFEGAFRGMRNPLASWHKSDSDFNKDDYCISSNPEENCADCEYFQGFGFPCFKIGENDMNLARRLISGGTEHRKFLRQIMVSVDITAPLYWWKEFDTYKVGTTANSTSTMHKLASTPITKECFEMDDFEDTGYYFCEVGDDTVEYTTSDLANDFIENLERLRAKYNETKDKRYWKELVRWLPNGWLQTRTVTMNYENLRSMYHQRENHKLTEWHSFCNWVKTLPYAQELIID
jgi:hypothetical protein